MLRLLSIVYKVNIQGIYVAACCFYKLFVPHTPHPRSPPLSPTLMQTKLAKIAEDRLFIQLLGVSPLLS